MNAPFTPTTRDIAAELAPIVGMHLAGLNQSPTPSECELFHAEQAVKHNAQRLWTIAKLTAIKEAANRAIDAAMTRRTFDLHYSWEGHAVFNAMHDLTGCDELYDMAAEIATLAPQGDVQ
jgi:hypothetical protein